MIDKLEALRLEAETLSGLMMQLAENEIDSDSFAVMSDLGENGQEHECDLPITETALRAAAVIGQLLAALEELKAKTSTCMGVGNGSGNLFVYGDYDSIKAAQRIVLDSEKLRAALEEKDQELDKEGDILIDTQESMREWKQRAEAAKQREEHLKADAAVMGKRIAELEQRPQRPIKLPDGFRIVPIKPAREQLAVVQVAGKSVVYTDMVLAAPEYPGFKVEGE